MFSQASVQWRIWGGRIRRAPPLRTKISLISYGFSENITKILGRRPPRDWRPLLGEVLDPPLLSVHICGWGGPHPRSGRGVPHPR